jgi:hypothetical protein
MAWGAQSTYLDQLLERGHSVPAAYLKRPRLHPQFQFYWDAFWELSSDRQVGMAIGRIPFSSIDRYAQRYDLDQVDEFDLFREVMRSMDAEFRRLSSPEESKKGLEVKATDIDGVRAVFDRLSKRQEANGDT